jgi:hypothetical protein
MRLAVLAGAAKDDVVGSDGVAAPVCNALDHRFERRILERFDLAAVVADEVVMMVAAGMYGLEARDAVAEVDTLDERESVESFERPIDACDPDASAGGAQALVDLLRR